MKGKWRRRPGWLGKLFWGGALGFSCASGPLYAQALPEPTVPIAVAPAAVQSHPDVLADPSQPAISFPSAAGSACCDPCAPAWCDPVSRVPNFFGGFFASSLHGSQAVATVTTPLHFTGVGAEGGGFTNFTPLGPVAGPKGPYSLTQTVIVPAFVSSPPFVFPATASLPENPELTNLVKMNFPGVSFVAGSVTLLGFREVPPDTNFFYDYLSSISTPTITVCLPNPAGGGLVGRNLYFENGAALPQDRVYFFYNHVGNFQQGCPLDVNRYVFGAEKTFFDGRISVELRVPFAGTANSDQVGDQSLSVNHTEFGNLGLAVKGVVCRTPNFAASIGLGFSLPTADSSQMFVAGTPIIEIQNRTCLLQPMMGLAWAPNDRFFAQAGLQFDLDPSGNPVRGLNANGGLSRIGVLNDQSYAFVNAAAGYWLYVGNCGRLTGVALQTELDYYRSFGDRDAVQSGALTVTDATGSVNVLNITPGAIFEFGKQTRFSLGVSFPVTGDRLYDWNLTAQFNYNF